MMRTKFFFMMLAAIVMGSQVTLLHKKRKELNLKEGSLIKSRCWKYSAIKL